MSSMDPCAKVKALEGWLDAARQSERRLRNSALFLINELERVTNELERVRPPPKVKHTRRCEICNEWMDVTYNRTHKRMHKKCGMRRRNQNRKGKGHND